MNAMSYDVASGCTVKPIETASCVQQAIDEAAARGGGTVEVKAGVYRLRDALHLRSSVHLRGETGAVLQKTPSVSSAIASSLGFGFYEFTVEEPDKFEVGMGVHIADEKASGFYTTVATIVRREGDVFFINRPFNHDYNPQHGGRVTSLFSLIDGTDVQDVSVENLILDGNREETERLTGCRGSGVFMLRSQRVRLQNLEVRHYRGDAISFQQCADIAVRRCHLHHNSNGGLHPGSGTVRYLMTENHIHDNGAFGVFYCLRTTHSLCADNVIEHNGEAGISIGERDSDHLIERNTIRDNNKQGIIFQPARTSGGDRVRVEHNTIGPNCRRYEGEDAAEIAVQSGLHDLYIANNNITTASAPAFFVHPDGARRFLVNNVVDQHLQQRENVRGAADAVNFDAPDALPLVGPEALPLEGALHLNLAPLSPWNEVAPELLSD
jgi:hypothetical protein